MRFRYFIFFFCERKKFLIYSFCVMFSHKFLLIFFFFSQLPLNSEFFCLREKYPVAIFFVFFLHFLLSLQWDFKDFSCTCWYDEGCSIVVILAWKCFEVDGMKIWLWFYSKGLRLTQYYGVLQVSFGKIIIFLFSSFLWGFAL